MKTTLLTVGALACGLLGVAVSNGGAQDHAADRLYGEVRTAAGQVYEGFIRWDRNEGSWYDILDGTRDVDAELVALARGAEVEENDRARSVEFLGVRISWNEDPEGATSAQAGIRFGHVRSLQVAGDDRARLVLRSGQEVELFGGSTDLGSDLRELTVEGRQGAIVELRWRDLDRIDFKDVPSGVRPASARLYGVVEDRWGNTFEGYVAWDLDEIFGSDVLDGREGRTDHEIAFDRIVSIERLGSSSSLVTLVDGVELELGGSNDVGQGHRGVQISDPELGQIHVPWSAFRVVRFSPAASAGAGRAAFDGGQHPLRGTVETEDGESLTGAVIWDADEGSSWEMLNGEWRGLVFDIEFGRVASIRKRGNRSAEVTLRDGRTFELEGSNDVDRGNKGILVDLGAGEWVAVSWDRFRRLTLEER